jgi:hypothetical protein
MKKEMGRKKVAKFLAEKPNWRAAWNFDVTSDQYK